MIKNPSFYESSKRESLSRSDLSIGEKFRILDAMYREAVAFGHFGQHDMLLGLEDDIQLAAALNANVSSPPR